MRTHILMTTGLIAATVLCGESLWVNKSNNESSMFADRTAGHVGDILSIRIDESTVVSRNTSKATSSSTSVSHDIDSYLFPPNLSGTSGSKFGTHNGTMPSIGISPNDSFSGEGSYSDTNIVEAQVAVLVVDVLPNGNLVVEGARKIEANDERQYLVMRGIVRRDDVMPDNSVMSSNVVNANVEVIGDGDLLTAQKKGRIHQLIDALNIL